MTPTNIVNDLLRLQYFSKKWRSADEFMMPKLEEIGTYPHNWLLISLMQAISKMAKRLIVVRIQQHTKEHNIRYYDYWSTPPTD